MAERTARQKKQKRERSYQRRQQARLEARDDAVDVDTGERFKIEVLDGDGPKNRNRAPVAEEHLKLLRPPKQTDVEDRAIKKRQRYAPMRGRQEIAAMVIAAGGTKQQAARKVGVSRRQISKYMASADFRDRIAELHETLATKIRGKIIREIDKRTTPEMIKRMELLDVLRVGDRFGLGRGNGSVIINDNREVHNYEATFNQLFHGIQDSEQLLDSEEEGADFPEFEPTSLALSGGDSPIEG